MKDLIRYPMKTLNIAFTALLITLLCSSCEDQFLHKLDRPDTKQKLSAFCIIKEGQQEVRCILSKAQAIFGQPPSYSSQYDIEYVRDAVVKITGNGSTYTFTYSQNDEWYAASVPSTFLTTGEWYVLTIESPSEGVLTSKTYIPSIAVDQMDLKIDSVKVDRGFWEYYEYLSYFKFKDDPSPDDAYMINSICIYDTLNDITEVVNFEIPFILDDENNGAVLQRIGKNSKDQDWDYLKFYTKLHKVTKDYMLYHQSVNGNANSIDEGPFSEPVISYTNIEGGLGLFSGVAEKTFVFVVN